MTSPTGQWFAGERTTAEKLQNGTPTARIARYYQSVPQTGLSGIVAVKFDFADRVSPLLTANATKDLFTFESAGWWDIEWGVRMQMGTFSGEAEAFCPACPLLNNNNTRYRDPGAIRTTSNGVVKPIGQFRRVFAAGDTVAFNMAVNNGGATYSTQPHTEAISVSFWYMGPAV